MQHKNLLIASAAFVMLVFVGIVLVSTYAQSKHDNDVLAQQIADRDEQRYAEVAKSVTILTDRNKRLTDNCKLGLTAYGRLTVTQRAGLAAPKCD